MASLPLVGASQLRLTLCAVPVPLRLTTVVGLEVELLLMVRLPVAAPAVVGSNCRSRFTDCPAFKVSGKVWPETEKPAPVIVAAFTVMLEPVAVKVNDWDVGVFSDVLPKAMLVELTESPATAPAASLREMVWEVPPEDAVRVTV